jgi:hypothetical protein
MDEPGAAERPRLVGRDPRRVAASPASSATATECPSVWAVARDRGERGVELTS